MVSFIEFSRGARGQYHAIIDGRVIATAVVNDAGNYVQALHVHAKHRRQGVATALIRFIALDRGRKLTRAPNKSKNAAVKALSAKLGEELDG